MDEATQNTDDGVVDVDDAGALHDMDQAVAGVLRAIDEWASWACDDAAFFRHLREHLACLGTAVETDSVQAVRAVLREWTGSERGRIVVDDVAETVCCGARVFGARSVDGKRRAQLTDPGSRRAWCLYVVDDDGRDRWIGKRVEEKKACAFLLGVDPGEL